MKMNEDDNTLLTLNQAVWVACVCVCVQCAVFWLCVSAAYFAKLAILISAGQLSELRQYTYLRRTEQWPQAVLIQTDLQRHVWRCQPAGTESAVMRIILQDLFGLVYSFQSLSLDWKGVLADGGGQGELERAIQLSLIEQDPRHRPTQQEEKFNILIYNFF